MQHPGKRRRWLEEGSRQSLTDFALPLLRPLSALTLCFPQLLQEKDEMLQELEKDLAQVKNTLVKKEMELEKQQCMTRELEVAIQEERRDKCKAEYGHLGAEIKKLKDCLEDAKQQHRLAGEAPGQALSPHTPTHGARAAPSFPQMAVSLSLTAFSLRSPHDLISSHSS